MSFLNYELIEPVSKLQVSLTPYQLSFETGSTCHNPSMLVENPGNLAVSINSSAFFISPKTWKELYGFLDESDGFACFEIIG